MVAVLLRTEETGAALVVDGVGFVVFEDFDRRGDLVSVGSEDDAVDGARTHIRTSGRGGPRIGVGGFGVGIGIGVARAGLGAGWSGGCRLEERLAVEGGEADLHPVGDGVGGGTVDVSLHEQGGDAVNVGEDGGGVFGEFEFDGRAGFPGPRVRSWGTRIGDEEVPWSYVWVGVSIRIWLRRPERRLQSFTSRWWRQKKEPFTAGWPHWRLSRKMRRQSWIMGVYPSPSKFLSHTKKYG